MLEELKVNCVAILKSRYGFKDKLKMFKVLSLLYLKYKIKRKNSPEVTHKILDFKVTAYDYHTLMYLFREVFLSKEYYFEAENPKPTIIDCGANIGMSILYFKFLYPNCRITAFEPNPFAFALLEKNISQNNLKDIDLHNIGLSDVESSIQFFIGENKGGLSGSMIKERGGKNAIDIQADRLSKFIQEATVDLIKMDVEGAETQVLKDLVSENKLSNSRKYIIEYHHKINQKRSSLSAFIKPFEDAGFEYNIRTNYLNMGDFQDVLLTFYKER